MRYFGTFILVCMLLSGDTVCIFLQQLFRVIYCSSLIDPFEHRGFSSLYAATWTQMHTGLDNRNANNDSIIHPTLLRCLCTDSIFSATNRIIVDHLVNPHEHNGSIARKSRVKETRYFVLAFHKRSQIILHQAVNKRPNKVFALNDGQWQW